MLLRALFPSLVENKQNCFFDDTLLSGGLKYVILEGAQWLSDRVLDSRERGRRLEPHWGHRVVSLSKTH